MVAELLHTRNLARDYAEEHPYDPKGWQAFRKAHSDVREFFQQRQRVNHPSGRIARPQIESQPSPVETATTFLMLELGLNFKEVQNVKLRLYQGMLAREVPPSVRKWLNRNSKSENQFPYVERVFENGEVIEISSSRGAPNYPLQRIKIGYFQRE